MSGFVATMPGRMGDVLFSMLIVRELSKRHGPARIVTSAYCAPLARLLMELPYVSSVDVVSEQVYRIEHTHWGAQPWSMPLPVHAAGGRVYHLGFRHFPRLGQSVPELAGEPYGVEPAPGPWLPLVRVDPEGPVAMPVSSPRWLVDMVFAGDRPIRSIGYRGEPNAGLVGTPQEMAVVEDYLDIHRALDGCSAFWGNNSGPSIVAMGAGLPVVWAFDGKQEPERWAHHGCDVSEVDQQGRVRRLRP